jgi:hypothetical protein
MEIDFEENPALKWLIIGIVILLIGGGAYYYMHMNKGETTKNADTGKYDYLFVSLPSYMTIQSDNGSNPFIIGDNQIRIPTNVKLVYITGVHYEYQIQNNAPVLFASETITAKYTGNPSFPLGVMYTEVGSDASGPFSNFYNLYFLNGKVIGTVAVNGQPIITTLDAYPEEIISTMFNYGQANAVITTIGTNTVLALYWDYNENGATGAEGIWFLNDRLVYEKSYVLNNATCE